MTADAIADLRLDAVPRFVEPRLREMDLGDFDGLPARDVHTTHPDLITQWRSDPSQLRMPGPTAETLTEVQTRSIAALSELAARYPGQDVAVVTHTFVLLSVLCHVLGVPLSQFRRLFVDRASLTIIEFGGEYPVLRSFNDVAHLRPSTPP